MNRILLAGIACACLATGAATAADLPVKAPPLVAPAPTWTGFYMGVSVGGEWLHDTATLSLPPGPPQLFLPFVAAGVIPTSYQVNASGVIASFQVGYNWQIDQRWVVGLEADISGPRVGATQNITTNVTVPFVSSAALQYQTNVDYVGTVRGRFGALVTPTLLAYATGGLAYGRVSRSFTEAQVFPAPFPPITQTIGSTQSVDLGWAVGGGLEYAVTNHFTVRGEYLFIQLSGGTFTTTSINANCGAPNACSFTLTSNNPTIQIARFGLNYKF